MPIYTCPKCNDFTTTKKTDFERHLNKKISCDNKSLEERVAVVEAKLAEKEEPCNSSRVILSLVQNLHDVMRKPGITGQKAYYDIIRLLLLKFMEPYMSEGGKLVDILNPEHYDNIPEFEEIDVRYLKFSNLADEDVRDRDFDEIVTLVWNMLSLHPFTNAIFPKNKAFNAPDKILDVAVQKIQETLKNVNFSKLEEDIGGSIYEHFVNKKGGGGGQSLGQYFTPRKLINLIMQLNKEIFVDHKQPETIYDPCAGTCGFLTEMYKTFDIVPSNVYGGELEPDTFANGLMNLILTTGSLCNLINGDSLRNNSAKKYDWIGTNPPFGVKNIKYTEVVANVEFKAAPLKKGNVSPKATNIPAKEMYPISMADGSALFLQHCIAKLATDGRCNIVLPAGQLLTGKGKYAELRAYLIKECTLYAVLAVPGGVFDNAGVATVVLFFSKYDSTCTSSVDFYETDKSCASYIKLGTVESEELEAKNYFLDYKYYNQVDVYRPIDSTWDIKTLGEVCELIKGKHSSTKTKISDAGVSKFITIAFENKWQNCDIFDFDEDAVFVSNVSSGVTWPVHYYHGKFAYCSLLWMLKTDRNILLPKYLYYYLVNNIQKNIMKKYIKGAANKSLDIEIFNDIKIPIPSLEKQQEIVTHCNKYDNDSQEVTKLIESIENNKQLLREIYIDPLFKDGNVKTLGEVCEYLPKRGSYQSKNGKDEGLYRFYTCSEKIKYVDECHYDEPSLIINRNGNAMVRFDNKFSAEKDHIYVLKTKNSVNIKYVYYYLSNRIDAIDNMMTGVGIKNITKEKLDAFKIPVPSLEKQQEVVDKYKLVDSMLTMYHEARRKIEDEKNAYLQLLFNNTTSSN